ncbi:DUF2306 domain-containing protein [uncultured Chitinophaga sp.]|uniref:DUF2306 domain-containing protein n=1 Tax=uncultured Chitinophaga sp. TaxID=339340 RepID=UPI0025F392FD|nr:DUF2306 domain-containing protein [uncultured Chitinophaga sp.]
MKNMTADKRLAFSDVFSILLWMGIVFLTWSFMQAADHFLRLTPEAMGKYFKLRWVLLMHITAGGGALILGPLQFWGRLRAYGWKLHRIIGTLYLLAIICSSITAAILSSTTAYAVNWAYAFSLQVWVTVWITATFIAWWAAIKRKFKLHQEWMTRSYLVTLAFVVSGTLVKLPVVQRLGEFADISPSLFWLGWAAPLYLYEVVLSVKRKA